MPSHYPTKTFIAIGSLVGLAALAACSSNSGSSDQGSTPGTPGTPDPKTDREEGQTDFASAPPIGQGGGGASFGATDASGAASSSSGGTSGGTNSPAPAAPGADNKQATSGTATPEETDIYRVDGDRLYFLNSYRGLMVFDVSDVDNPKLLGRSPVFGTPVEMFVQNGIATMVVGDWYGTAPDGSPFHGSVVRTVDARDPTHMVVEGEVQVKGWARDMRVVGSNLFIVSEDYGWVYGWAGYYGGAVGVVGAGYYGYGASKVIVSSVGFGDHAPTLNATKEFDGSSGAFNVSSNALLLAHDLYTSPTSQGGQMPTGKAQIDFIAFDQATGGFSAPSSIQVDGQLQGWGADNGRWNIDYDPDTKVGAAITCGVSPYGYCSGGTDGYNLTTLDFSDPALPKTLGTLHVTNTGWAATARFANKRMYLSPSDGAFTQTGVQLPTPFQIYDLSIPSAPKLAGSTNINGAVWLFMPVGTDRVFSLGNEYGAASSSNQVAVNYFDVTDATQPKLIGTSRFGDGWAWTPASGTFKAFIRDDTQKLVVLPFSGWDAPGYQYRNGVQLIEYATNSITTKGAATSKGWVERGIFVKNRIVSLSDQALSVVDYTDRLNPKVTKELTLARNIVSAQPGGATIAQLSTDWWGYDNQASELRVLPLANAEEDTDDGTAKSVSIPGSDANVFRNGDLAYVVTTEYPPPDKNGNGYWYQRPRVQVVDLANGNAVARGSISLPDNQTPWYWAEGWYYYDWYDGSNVVQVGGDTLAFRRIQSSYNPMTGRSTFSQELTIVDLHNPDAPAITTTQITPDPDSWWGNIRVVGNTLYTSHWEWIEKPVLDTGSGSSSSSSGSTPQQVVYWVKYYLDQIDLTDRAHPKVGQKINVPGILIGASDTDPSLLYFVDYRWYTDWSYTQPKDEIAVARIKDGKAYLKSSTLIDGWVGNVFVRADKAYMSAQTYMLPTDTVPEGQSLVQLHELDLTDPAHPVDRKAAPKAGWGWLLGVEGDRAIVTSGWGNAGLDIYQLIPGQTPVYSQFARTRGWWASSLSRQDDDLYVASGYWGVQRIHLK
jgi:hypothetical protein